MTSHPDLTFERFTPTRGSQQALELAVALAEETAEAPSLLLLHGPPGVGKTHLLRAILNLRAARRPRQALLQAEAGHLVAQCVAALRGEPEASLLQRLERADLVGIDDLHSLAGKPVTQGEVARIVERTVSRGGRVVCALTGSPPELPVLEEALRRLPQARFAPMQRLRNGELRHVLEVMARAEHLPLGKETLAAIADTCNGDVRCGQGRLARHRFERAHSFVRQSLRVVKL